MGQLVEDFDPSTISVFSTRNQTKTSNEYFLTSGGNISFFFEGKVQYCNAHVVHHNSAQQCSVCVCSLFFSNEHLRVFSSCREGV